VSDRARLDALAEEEIRRLGELLLYADVQRLKAGEYQDVLAALEQRARRHVGGSVVVLVVYAVLVGGLFVLAPQGARLFHVAMYFFHVSLWLVLAAQGYTRLVRLREARRHVRQLVALRDEGAQVPGGASPAEPARPVSAGPAPGAGR